MKIQILILGIILCTAIVYADKVDVYSFKVYSTDETKSERLEVSWEDEEFEIYTGTTMEIQIRFDNNWNETIEIDIEGTLFEIGDDIIREKTLEIEEGEKKTAVFEYYIPTDTREDIYELEIKYEYDAQEGNQTLHYEKKKKFEVDIRKKTTPQEDILINITRHLAEEKKRTNDLLSTVIETTNLSLRLDECRSDLNDERLEGDFKSKYENELNMSRDYESRFNTCNVEKQNMYSKSQLDAEIQNAETNSKREQKKDDDWFTIIVAGAIIGYFQWRKKKETVGGKGEGVSVYGARWK